MKLIGEQELKEVKKNNKEEYLQKLSLKEIRLKTENNLKHIIKLGEVIAQEYEKKQLNVVAKWCKEVSQWFKEAFETIVEPMDELIEKELGYSLQAIVIFSEFKNKTTHTNETKTEDELKTEFEEKTNKILTFLPKVIAILQRKDKEFWVRVHYNVIDFLEKLFNEVDIDMEREYTTELRVKNYEILNTYLDDLFYYRNLALPRMPNL